MTYKNISNSSPAKLIYMTYKNISNIFFPCGSKVEPPYNEFLSSFKSLV